MSPVKSVANYPTTMAGALEAADRVFEVLDLASEEGDRPGEVPARFEQRIEYRGVSCSYNGQAPVLEGLDFEVRRGQVFFSSRRRHTRLQGDWSSDVCSSD